MGTSLGSVSTDPHSYGTNNPVFAGGTNIYGTTGGATLTVGRIEVFTIAPGETSPAVPEPGAAVLFLPALAVMGFRRRRRPA